MNTDLQPKKSLSRKRKLMTKDDITSKIIANDWNPFERVDPKVLEKVRQESIKQHYEEAPL